MNTLVQHLCTVALAASATIAVATPDPGVGERVEIATARDTRAAALAVLSARHFDSSYQMVTGQRMRVSTTGDALHVRYGRRMARTLHHDGQGSFVSNDGTLALRFELDDVGEAQRVRLTMPARWM